jgi:hypothetical protein
MSGHHQSPPERTKRRTHIPSFVLRLRSQTKQATISENTSSEGSKTACRLHTLPPELRQEIFKPLLINWNGKTPNLIKALRPDEKLYNEAWALFCAFNVFTFHTKNGWGFGDMGKAAVLRLDKVKICIE